MNTEINSNSSYLKVTYQQLCLVMKVGFSGHCFLLTHSQNEMLNSHNIQETNISPSQAPERDLFSLYPGKKKKEGNRHNSYILQIICKK
jgi:hypothetical protein